MSKPRDRSKESKLRKYMKAPLRFLTKVKDKYVHGMIQCSTRFAYADVAVGYTPVQHYTLPRSFSVNSAPGDDDFKHLVRAASLRTYGNRSEFGDAVVKMPRSRSLGIGRIDEDTPCEYFEDDVFIKDKPNIYPPSTSYHRHRGGAASRSGVLLRTKLCKKVKT